MTELEAILAETRKARELREQKEKERKEREEQIKLEEEQLDQSRAKSQQEIKLELKAKKEKEITQLQKLQREEQVTLLQQKAEVDKLQATLASLEKKEDSILQNLSKKQRLDMLTTAILDSLLGKNNENIEGFKAWIDLMKIKRPDLVFSLMSKLLPNQLELEAPKAAAPIIIFNNAKAKTSNKSNTPSIPNKTESIQFKQVS